MEEVQRQQALQAKVKHARRSLQLEHAAEHELARLRCALPGEQARRAAA